MRDYCNSFDGNDYAKVITQFSQNFVLTLSRIELLGFRYKRLYLCFFSLILFQMSDDEEDEERSSDPTTGSQTDKSNLGPKSSASSKSGLYVFVFVL